MSDDRIHDDSFGKNDSTDASWAGDSCEKINLKVQLPCVASVWDSSWRAAGWPSGVLLVWLGSPRKLSA
jgi:hypothetical protein